jgi:ribonuclease HI
MEYKIFTDGSSRGNPGPGGWGAIIIGEEEVSEIGGREVESTNNRMELTAAIEAIAKTKNNSEIILYSDSSYMINGITKWVFGWQKNNWQTKDKNPVSNVDLWKRLIDETKNRNVTYKYIGGHVGIAGNERCDQIATSYADNKEIDLYRGALSKYQIRDIMNVSQQEEKIKNKSIDKARSRSKAYSYISSVSGEVMVHKTWAECENRVKGVKKARFKKALSQEEEKKIFEEFSRM